MRMFDGDVDIASNPDGGLRVILIAKTGETVAADVPPRSVNTFRLAVMVPGVRESLDMSQIKKVTEFLKTDMPALNKKASDLHERAVGVHSRAEAILDGAGHDLTDLETEIAELESEMRQGTNFPPKDETV